MLQDALFVPARDIRMRAAVFPAAVLIHAAFVLLLIALPLLRVGDMPRLELTAVLVAPPPPVPPPPPPKGNGRPAGARTRIKPVALNRPGFPGPLVAPVAIPNNISDEPIDMGGWGGGLDGGVDYGMSGGLPKDLFGDVLYQVIGEPAAPVLAAGQVRPPRCLRRVEPVYPEIARQARVQGVVILEATTDMYGRVLNVRILRSVPLLDQAAVEAVRQWLYEPLVINGRPRPVTFNLTVRFELK